MGKEIGMAPQDTLEFVEGMFACPQAGLPPPHIPHCYHLGQGCTPAIPHKAAWEVQNRFLSPILGDWTLTVPERADACGEGSVSESTELLITV